MSCQLGFRTFARMISELRHTRHRRTLLGIWAHPDDESFLSAGLMLQHVAAGDRVVVITATLGEHGTDDPYRWPPPQLAWQRRRELQRSLGQLGVGELRLLGFEDGTCDQFDAADLLAHHIADVRPDRIVTFGPDGLTGHPDHRAVSGWATAAWLTTGCESELWYATLTPAFHDRWAEVNAQVGFWMEHDLAPSTDASQLAASIVLAGADLRRKVAALGEHRTQIDPIVRQIGWTALSQWWSVESFRAATLAEASALVRPGHVVV
jgi:LmbE family N-acetylglucosaminyl deacetylase